jgi:hypothetical protein
MTTIPTHCLGSLMVRTWWNHFIFVPTAPVPTLDTQIQENERELQRQRQELERLKKEGKEQ